ncbi:M15 family metallopeptidase [Paenibacillus humicus]|uniref:M15 family metallopeptidase n=1 Tax=Paenibacillus humicus TaxID=412861 RepID=UPI000FD7DA5E|nr:M15 family metallopeptidase [Paenibacillus humicus]
MKKYAIIGLLILAAAGCAAREPRTQPGPAAPSQTASDNPASDRAPATESISVGKAQIKQGNLVLVNKEHAVPSTYTKSDVVNLYEHKELLEGYGLLDNKIRLSKSVALRFIAMVKDADKDGVNHFLISSGYRSDEEQDKLYRELGGNSALPPGHSEHNLGLSLDIGSSTAEMSKAPEGKWLKKNAWKYGFILRYPEDKTDVTGIRYEPWHFRYVGLPHSAVMHREGLVLEEYLNLLKDRGAIETEVDGAKYRISYYPVQSKTTVKIPAGKPYELSGNNSDGVIVTVRIDGAG